MHVGDGGQPLRAEQVREDGPVGVALALAAEPAVLLPGHAAARSESLLNGREDVREGDAVACERRQVGKGVAVDQDLGVACGQPKAPLLGLGTRVVHLEDPGDGLLLQPLPGVALVRPRRARELGRRGLAAVRQGAVVAEPVAQVDGHELVGAERGPEEALGQRVPPGFLGLRGHHRSSVRRAADSGRCARRRTPGRAC